MGDIPSTRPSLLLRLRNAHDGAAWGEFVALYAPLVYGYARKQGLQDADAADLTQDVLQAVAAGLGRLDYDPAKGAFRNWLFTVVRRKLSKWRSAQEVRPNGDSATRRLLEQFPAPDAIEPAWEAEWEQRLFAWACEQVKRDVAEATWRAFWRTAVDGLPGKRVAAEVGLSVADVYLARRRVLARLRGLVQSAQEP